MSDLDTLEIEDTDETTETTGTNIAIPDEEHATFIEKINNSEVDSHTKEQFKRLLDQAVWDMKILRGEERVRLVLDTIQDLHKIKSEYCKNNGLDECPELHQITININFYLHKQLDELSVKEAQLHSERIG